jgi:signal transduction histidine kinase
VIGAVIVRQSGEQYLSLTDRAFSRLLGYSLLAVGIGALGLLGYASLLSWRIRRLSQAAGEVVRDDGVILDNFPRSSARDEIGELSRRYDDLLAQLREYHDYLRSLSRKLSHELRTPIAVIQTSLENLEQTSAPAGTYLARAREGLARLNRILTAMSEANRLEESIRNHQPETFDLVPLLREVSVAYGDVYPGHRVQLDMVAEAAPMRGVPELIIQALDKLLDNAASFTPANGVITLSLRSHGDSWQLAVGNEGPPLPEELQERLFDPMVSLREEEGEQLHLGLGLHIVRLIAEYHGGRVRAQNLPDHSGVQVTLDLPR